jgi:hypothetical protein
MFSSGCPLGLCLAKQLRDAREPRYDLFQHLVTQCARAERHRSRAPLGLPNPYVVAQRFPCDWRVSPPSQPQWALSIKRLERRADQRTVQRPVGQSTVPAESWKFAYECRAGLSNNPSCCPLARMSAARLTSSSCRDGSWSVSCSTVHGTNELRSTSSTKPPTGGRPRRAAWNPRAQGCRTAIPNRTVRSLIASRTEQNASRCSGWGTLSLPRLAGKPHPT